MNNTPHYADQRHYLDYVVRDNYDGKPREILIREMAADIVSRAETYTLAGFTFIVMLPRRGPTTTFLTENDALPPPRERGYVEIGPVRLAPELQGAPYVAQIIVERMIRPEWP